MRRLLHILTTTLLIISGIPLLAQQDRQLDTVRIEDSRLHILQTGHRLERIDSVSKHIWGSNNLADLLAAESDVFIKQYGPGTLATTSMRGGSAAHTALIWNGFNLQNPMNGQTDWALLPVFFLDDVAIQYGGSAAMYGSGAVGGAIHLNNRPALGSGWNVAAHESIGSFGNFQHGLDASLSRNKWSVRSRAFYRTAENDFPIPGTERLQPNGALEQSGWLGEAAFQPGKQDLVQVWAWVSGSERQIPPPLTSDQSIASQRDQQQRLAANWTHQRRNGSHSLRAAWIDESLTFRDPSADLLSHNHTRQWMLDGESTWRISPRQHITGGIHQQVQIAKAEGLGGDAPLQYRLAGFLSWKYQGNDWQSYATLRQGTQNGTLTPITPSVGGNWQPAPWLTLRGQAGRTFRLPTFNDLYWTPGGNPDLLPESGWNQEVGLSMNWLGSGHGRKTRASTCAGLKDSTSRFSDFPSSHLNGFTSSLLTSFTLFNQTTDNWILWRPGPGYWFPDNVRSVWSRGAESSLKLLVNTGEVQWSFSGAYTYTKATVQAVDIPRDRSLGQQLIYVPVHQARGHVSVEWRGWTGRYGHQTTGKRYTATDGSAWLAPFQLGNLYLAKRWNFAKWTFQGGLRCDNLWNASYQVMDNRPMPGRSFLFSLDIFFHQPNFSSHSS